MEELVQIGREFVQAMRERRGISHVEDIYAKNAQSVEAVVPPGRELRIAKGRGAIKGKRLDWVASHDLIRLEVDGPYVHPPDRFGVRFEAEVIQKDTGKQIILCELGIYSVENGEIVKEEFFMMPK